MFGVCLGVFRCLGNKISLNKAKKSNLFMTLKNSNFIHIMYYTVSSGGASTSTWLLLLKKGQSIWERTTSGWSLNLVIYRFLSQFASSNSCQVPPPGPYPSVTKGTRVVLSVKGDGSSTNESDAEEGRSSNWNATVYRWSGKNLILQVCN